MPTTVVRGAQRRLVPPFPIKLVQILSGYLVVRSVLSLATRHLLGYEVKSRVSWDGRAVTLHLTTWLLGREVRHLEERLVAADLVSVGLERRFPHLLLLLGALGVLVGAIVGIGWVVDGLEAHYVPIALVGLGVLAAGVLFDVVIGALADYIGSRTSLVVSVRRARWWLLGRRIRIVGVDEPSARAFIEAVSSPRR